MLSRLLLDVNVAVALVYEAYPNHSEAIRLLEAMAGRGLVPLYPASSLNELFYVLVHNARRELRLAPEEAKAVLADFVGCVSLVDTTAMVVAGALALPERDYEDAVVQSAAREAVCDAIVTYDRRGFRESPVRALPPLGALAEL